MTSRDWKACRNTQEIFRDKAGINLKYADVCTPAGIGNHGVLMRIWAAWVTMHQLNLVSSSATAETICHHRNHRHIIISYRRLVVLKRQNRLKVGTDKPTLKVKMQSVSDDDVRKRLLEQPRFQLAAKGVFRLGRCYIFWQGVPGLRASSWESTATDGWSFDRWHQKTMLPLEQSYSQKGARGAYRPPYDVKENFHKFRFSCVTGTNVYLKSYVE